MNLRQYKKAAKRAAAQLARRYPGEFEFAIAPTNKWLPRPAAVLQPRMRWRAKWNGWRQYVLPLKGTPQVRRDGGLACPVAVLQERILIGIFARAAAKSAMSRLTQLFPPGCEARGGVVSASALARVRTRAFEAPEICIVSNPQ